jgi:hypothetical protein
MTEAINPRQTEMLRMSREFRVRFSNMLRKPFCEA